MQPRKISIQIHPFRLERALLSFFELVKVVVGQSVIEIGLCWIQFIEIQEITSADAAMIQKIMIDDVTCILKDFGPVSCLVRHRRKRQIGGQKPRIDGGSLGKRRASRILLVLLLKNSTQLKPGAREPWVDL